VNTTTNVMSPRGSGGAAFIGPAWASLTLRNRVLNLQIGRWISRDPLMYRDGGNLVEAYKANPCVYLDHSGLSVTISDEIKPYHSALMACSKSYQMLTNVADNSSGEVSVKAGQTSDSNNVGETTCRPGGGADVVIDTTQDPCQIMKTLAHEMCHAILCPLGFDPETGPGAIEEQACKRVGETATDSCHCP